MDRKQKGWQNRLDNSKSFFLGGILGYSFFWLTSHPTKSPLKKHLPEKRFKNISYFPNIKVERRDKNYWLHHWINLSVIYLLLLSKKNRLRRSKLAHGFLLGSILQGLLYKDRFHIVNKTAPLLIEEETHDK